MKFVIWRSPGDEVHMKLAQMIQAMRYCTVECCPADGCFVECGAGAAVVRPALFPFPSVGPQRGLSIQMGLQPRGELFQRIGPADVRLPLKRVDLTAAADMEATLAELMRHEARAAFDLEAGTANPRATGACRRTTMHHRVSDGWSRKIMKRELRELHAAARGARGPADAVAGAVCGPTTTPFGSAVRWQAIGSLRQITLFQSSPCAWPPKISQTCSAEMEAKRSAGFATVVGGSGRPDVDDLPSALDLLLRFPELCWWGPPAKEKIAISDGRSRKSPLALAGRSGGHEGDPENCSYKRSNQRE
ncbi:hypothetical protein [Mesorhizobium sp. M1403]|uniref:hypothetical protein n=1 Tax=Mesorhizobium sp. M1403 TaxID=2957097 RepID=UPI0033391E62